MIPVNGMVNLSASSEPTLSSLTSLANAGQVAGVPATAVLDTVQFNFTGSEWSVIVYWHMP